MENALGEVQSIVVLGGRSDIGRAIALHCASAFTRKVVLAGRNVSNDDVEHLHQSFLERGLSGIAVSRCEFDALAVDTHAQLAEDLSKEALDLVILAFGQLGDAEQMVNSPRQASDLFAVNTTGMVSAGLAFATALMKQGRGRLLFVSSVAGVRTRAGNFIYGASKAGMDAFASGLGDYLHPRGVGVTIVRPGFVRSSMTEGLKAAPFATDPDTVGKLVARGLKNNRRVIWTPGLLRYIFAVFVVLPSTVWRRLPLN